MDYLKLMIPGPVEVPDDVLAEMSRPVVAHYGAEWVKIYNETEDCLKTVFRTKNDLFLIVGSGSAALDAGVNSILERGEQAILGINGFFGERLREIALSYGVSVIPVEAAWGEPITPEMVEEAVKKNPQAKAVIMVHNETSTGVVNPIEEIGEIAVPHGLVLIVDAVTSAGGMQFDMDGWGVDIAVTASQKCLGAPPGLAVVAVSPKAWKTMEQRANPPWGWYLNLLNWRKYREMWKDWHPYPVTVATNNIVALRLNLLRILEDGLDNRIRRHQEAAHMVRDGIRKIGLKLVARDDFASSTVTAVETRPGLPSQQLIDFLKNEYRVQIANGLAKTMNSWFRIGHMGDSATNPEAIALTLRGIEEFYRTARERHDGED